mmetsp:Transcript_20456/g.52283  ORF Transcript_20456/g.52283 Transcript_20456/m.52283 type:complete len:236 (-) Transcript_20456:39-746(-)
MPRRRCLTLVSPQICSCTFSLVVCRCRHPKVPMRPPLPLSARVLSRLLWASRLPKSIGFVHWSWSFSFGMRMARKRNWRSRRSVSQNFSRSTKGSSGSSTHACVRSTERSRRPPSLFGRRARPPSRAAAAASRRCRGHRMPPRPRRRRTMRPLRRRMGRARSCRRLRRCRPRPATLPRPVTWHLSDGGACCASGLGTSAARPDRVRDAHARLPPRHDGRQRTRRRAEEGGELVAS